MNDTEPETESFHYEGNCGDDGDGGAPCKFLCQPSTTKKSLFPKDENFSTKETRQR